MIDDLTAFLERTWAFVQEHPGPWVAGGIASLVIAIVSIAFVPWAVRRLPADHFVGPVAPGADERPWWRTVVRNVFGWLFLVCGVAMLALPGQGVLTILLGLALADFPGKRRAEQALMRRHTVQRALDWIRVRGGREPFVVPEKDEA